MREKLAELCHSQWSSWISYMFSKGALHSDGSLTLPAWAVGRWTRQMNTDYANLSLEEKMSDIIEADKFMALIEANKD